MSLESTQNNKTDLAGTFKGAQASAQLLEEKPNVHSILIPE